MAYQPVCDGDVCHPPIGESHIGEDEVATPAIHVRKYPFLISNRCSPLDRPLGGNISVEIPMTVRDNKEIE
jgi:hypothetical protein